MPFPLSVGVMSVIDFLLPLGIVIPKDILLIPDESSVAFIVKFTVSPTVYSAFSTLMLVTTGAVESPLADITL